MKTNKKNEDWMEYLQERPKKAKRLIKEAKRRDIEGIEEKYSDVIRAYNETKAALDGLVVTLADLKKSGFDEQSSEFCEVYENNEKEWERLSYEFHLEHGNRYDAYEKEIESCNASYRELRLLILGK